MLPMTGEHQLTIQRKGGKTRDRCTLVSTQQIDDKSKHFIFVSAAQINQLFRVERVPWDQFINLGKKIFVINNSFFNFLLHFSYFLLYLSYRRLARDQ